MWELVWRRIQKTIFVRESRNVLKYPSNAGYKVAMETTDNSTSNKFFTSEDYCWAQPIQLNRDAGDKHFGAGSGWLCRNQQVTKSIDWTRITVSALMCVRVCLCFMGPAQHRRTNDAKNTAFDEKTLTNAWLAEMVTKENNDPWKLSRSNRLFSHLDEKCSHVAKKWHMKITSPHVNSTFFTYFCINLFFYLYMWAEILTFQKTMKI